MTMAERFMALLARETAVVDRINNSKVTVRLAVPEHLYGDLIQVAAETPASLLSIGATTRHTR